jgi:hypothetical protein
LQRQQSKERSPVSARILPWLFVSVAVSDGPISGMAPVWRAQLAGITTNNSDPNVRDG